MKRFWFGVALLLALMISGILLYNAMNRMQLPLAEKLTRTAEAARVSNISLANELLEDARQDWDRHRKALAAMADHQPMEEIEGLFAAADSYGLAEDEEEMAAACAHLAALIRALAESNRLSWWNLL